jgi:hypothetical protein
MRPRPFKRTFSGLSTLRYGGQSHMDAASRRHPLMSFEGMGKSIRTIEAPILKTDASTHRSDEFPAGYSLAGCSPALPASASPAGVDSDSRCAQLWVRL